MPNKIGKWKRISSRVAYQNPWMHVREDKVVRPDGAEGIYGVVVTPPAVFIVAVNDKKQIYLVGQHRYTTDMYSWEVPAGNTEGQDSLAAARRELEEETGLRAREWKKLGEFQSANGFMSEIGYVYLAQGLSGGFDHSQEEEGIDDVKIVDLKEAVAMIGRGEITDGQSIVALTRAALELGVIKT